MTDKTNKVPMRMCVGCRVMHEKKSLVRIVGGTDGAAHIDVTGRAQGRGAYVCRKRECVEKAAKSKAIERALGIRLGEEMTEALKEAVEKNEN